MSDTALVFERYDLVARDDGRGFSARYLFRRCSGKDWRAVVDEYTIAVNYHEAMPAAWANDPPTGILLGLGMAVLSAVWTGWCMPIVIVRAGPLSKTEVDFWCSTFVDGLREHFMLNRIGAFGEGHGLRLDLRCEAPPSRKPARGGLERTRPEGVSGAAQTAAASAASAASTAAADGPRRVLVPLGGGKDSTTVLEMMKAAGADVVPFFLSDPPGEWEECWRYAAVCEAAGVAAADVSVADFAWDDASWVLWHRRCATDEAGRAWDNSARLWACLVGFAAALAAQVRRCESVAVGNERSANIGNGALWGGVEVNHQHDKSFAFERRLDAYLQPHGGPAYFSALMHLWDVQVGELFCRIAPTQLPLILSCNEPLGRDRSRWCARCDKCAFVFALLSAYCEPAAVRAVFGDDLLETSEGCELLEALLGLRPAAQPPGRAALPTPATLPHLSDKAVERRLLSYVPGCTGLRPLDCVGSVAETRLALSLAEGRRQACGCASPRFFRSDAWAKVRPAPGEAAAFALLDDFNEEHSMPAWFESTARRLWTERRSCSTAASGV